MSIRERRPRLAAFVLGLLAGVLAVTLTSGLFYVAATVVVNDGKCPQGSFPATNVDVGGACFEDGADLPPGFTADPGGNSGLD